MLFRSEKKRLEALDRKKENQRLLDEESARIRGRAATAKEQLVTGKVTRAQIDETLRIEQQQLEEEPALKGSTSHPQSLFLQSIT